MITGRGELFTCAVGALAGILVSPDLDVDAGNVSNKIIKKKVGWFGERLWRWFWSGYTGSFKHGQFASHFPIFGTFMRVSYVYFWLIFLPHFLIKLLGFFSWNLIFVLTWYAKIFFDPLFFMGLAGADIVHWALDMLTTNGA